MCETAAIGCTQCKKNLSEILIRYLAPIREKAEGLTDARIKEILREGAKEAKDLASQTIDEVRSIVGLAR